MQAQDSCDPHLCTMKVKLEIPAKQQQQAMAAAPSRSLPRSVSELGDPPSPFSSNPSHHAVVVSTPTTPAAAAASSSSSSSSSFGCMTSRPATDSPPSTPTTRPKSKPGTPGGVAAAAAAAEEAWNASQWSPKRLMQRVGRVFTRSSRSRRLKTFRDSAAAAGDKASSSSPTRRGGSKVSDAATAAASPSVGSAAAAAADGNDADIAGGDAHGGATTDIGRQEEEQRHDEQYHPEAVPEKIIHEMKRHAPPLVAGDDVFGATPMAAPAPEGKETAAAAAEEEVESPKKAAAAVAPEPEPEVVHKGGEEVADKFVTVVKEAIRKHEEQGGGEKKAAAAARKFQSKVKTAMEARAESEQPRRRDPAPRSNDVIEEARSKLLEKRQCSRVRALVGAFETVMDANTKDAAAAATPRTPAAAAGGGFTPRHGYRSSVA
ncbi:unnamed protein product [Urochloa humidicola]